MNIDIKRQLIYDFIYKTFELSFDRFIDFKYNDSDTSDSDTSDLERYINGIESDSDSDTSDYADKKHTFENFMKHQKRCIKNSSEEDTLFVYELIKRIEYRYINISDEEVFVDFEASSVYFDYNGKLFIMYPLKITF